MKDRSIIDARGLPQYAINAELLQTRTRIKQKTLCQLFEENADRVEHFSLDACGLYLDYSKNFIDRAIIDHLVNLAKEANLQASIESLFRGDKLNITEDRPALHTALRDDKALAGTEVAGLVTSTLANMVAFADKLRSGKCFGYSDKAINNIVVLGIGGSYLGPKLACEALKDYHDTDLSIHFVASLDPVELLDTLDLVDPETTLFIVSSKSFTTLETIANAKASREWLLSKGCPQQLLARHFVAVTADQDKAREFGVSDASIFPIWDWVGGRYSLWSAIGLPILLAVGEKHFEELLKGARLMDEHFRTAPLENNMPVILALLGVWQRNYLGIQAQAIMPYSFRLRHLAEHLQQVDMESNGKSVNIHGAPVQHDTAPIVWGGMGNNGQHSFYQLFHQGTSEVAIDFILPCRSSRPLSDHQQQLAAKVFGQGQALMQGRNQSSKVQADDLDESHQQMSGDKASNTLLMESLTPESLGTLLALYEHKVFVQGICWQLNSFDQWGVNLGKQLSSEIAAVVTGLSEDVSMDESTSKLIEKFKHTIP